MTLSRRTPLRSRTRLRSVNPERRSRLREKQYGSDAFVRWIHRQPCSVPGCDARRVEQAHAVSRAAGGTWRDTLPLCRAHHREQHDVGILTFEREYDIDLRLIAAGIAERWEREHGGDE